MDCPLKLGGGTSVAEGVLSTKLVPPPPLRGYSSYPRRRIVGVNNSYIISFFIYTQRRGKKKKSCRSDAMKLREIGFECSPPL